MSLKISNREARLLWLDAQGLLSTTTGPVDVAKIVQALGFVQLDTIRVIERAHHHILWSRNSNYREPMLDKAFSEDRALFEHFTHDASLIPMAFYPYWRRQFDQLEQKISRRRGDMSDLRLDDLVERINKEGPLSTHAFESKIKGPKKMWHRPPHKQGLDYLWYAGVLSTSHREKFKKFYDLTERVIPQNIRDHVVEDDDQIDWLCHQALHRLGFATDGEIKRFWDAVSTAEVKVWRSQNEADLIPVEVEGYDGSWQPALSPPDIKERLEELRKPSSRIRILSPFDPVVRDRSRLLRLFGFHYRIEMFVPEKKRQWGYYVYPMLEGETFIGRVEVKVDRKLGQLSVENIWFEEGTRVGSNRKAKIKAELDRLKYFAGMQDVSWNCLL